MERIKLATPCTLDWRKMSPVEGGGRFCGDCKKVVRDLSKMTEHDAKTLLRTRNNAELCVRYVYDQHGRIIFGDAPKAAASADLMPAASLLSRARRAVAVAAVAAMASGATACDAVSGTLGMSSQAESNNDPNNDPNYPVGQDMGGMSVDPNENYPLDTPDAAPAAVDSGGPNNAEDGGIVITTADGGPAPTSDDDGGTHIY